METSGSYLEHKDAQVPALRLLQAMGYAYISPEQTMEQRNGLRSQVVLEDILRNQLEKLNSIEYKGEMYSFSKNTIDKAIKDIRDVLDQGLITTNEQIYDLLTLGKSYEETIQLDKKSWTFKYIDWEHPENNVYHVTDEFEVKGLENTRFPDVVLFVNGIPLVIMECKRRDKKNALKEAISQHIRNQKKENIPRLFHYSQILIASSVNEFKYATTNTPENFWSVWREKHDSPEAVTQFVGKKDEAEEWKKRLRSHYNLSPKDTDEQLEPTIQDSNLYNLCRPKRLLELIHRFIVFDNGVKKIARYQQYFGVLNTMERVREVNKDGTRKGGVIWHTQGSGKSISMVFMSRNLALAKDISNQRIMLVTDRTDLDDQLWKSFKSCGKEIEQASSGKNLLALLQNSGAENIATTIHKFDAASKQGESVNTSSNIFVLVDESHRTQYGEMHAKMKKLLPNACYIGFTGTPLMQGAEKNTSQKFGGIIDSYTMKEAVEDGAVVPLIYEGRTAILDVWKEKLDREFERDMEGMEDSQVREYKVRYSTLDKLLKSKHVISEIAHDISKHFDKNLKHTPYKAQLAVPDKLTGLRYYRKLKEIGLVNAELIISPPDTREGHDDVYDDPSDEVQKFWSKMMEKHRTKEEYESNIINLFKSDGEEVELLIVVNKLLTGFDAPRNTVIYLAKRMQDHTLLQAIARVNRLFEGKEYGHIIDYRGVLGKLSEALTQYDVLANFEEEDLESAVFPIQEIINSLPQLHSELWDVFKDCDQKEDNEALEKYLGFDDRRKLFYERLSQFARALQTSFSADNIYKLVSEEDLSRYKRDLKFFEGLRRSVRLRYAESIDHSEYESRVQKLIDSYVGTEGIQQVIEPVNVFSEAFNETQLELENPSEASKADRIARDTKKVITERMDEDPAMYAKFSEMIEETIRKYLDGRISDKEYLEKVREIQHGVKNQRIEGQPAVLQSKPEARAFYGIVKEEMTNHLLELKSKDNQQEVSVNPKSLDERYTQAGLEINEEIEKLTIVDWTSNNDVINQMHNSVEDYLITLFRNIELKRDFNVIERIARSIIKSAKVRYDK